MQPRQVHLSKGLVVLLDGSAGSAGESPAPLVNTRAAERRRVFRMYNTSSVDVDIDNSSRILTRTLLERQEKGILHGLANLPGSFPHISRVDLREGLCDDDARSRGAVHFGFAGRAPSVLAKLLSVTIRLQLDVEARRLVDLRR